jgi:hypothetical protein
VKIRYLALALGLQIAVPGFFVDSRVISTAVLGGTVSGSFRLEKKAYCVGEPILMEFMVANDSDQTFHFNLDYSTTGTLRQSFSFSVKSTAGRDFTRELDEPLERIIGPRTTDVLRDAMQSANTGNVIEPGALVEVMVKCNDFLSREEVQNILWRVEGFSKSMQVNLK